jgi:hypothetical protein
MNAISISNVFSTLLTRYRQQVTDLDDATDQADIDQLTDASQATLTKLVETRPSRASALADKIDALIRRYDDFGSLPMGHVRQLLLDAYHLADEPGMTLAWVDLWSDVGGNLFIDSEGHRNVGILEPPVIRNRYTSQLPANLKLASEEEARGAAKTLQALVRLAGKRAADAIFAFATVVKEG